MTPNNIAGMAALKELDVIALTDHNSAKNCGALMKAAAQYPLIVLPGMELCTSEEIHVVCLFDTLEKAMAPLPREEWGDWVYLGRDGHFVWWPELYPAGKIFPLGELEFEGEPFPVPRDPEGMLRKAYGDFWALPGDFAAGHPGMVPPEFTEERLRELLERVLEGPFEKQGGTENDHREETGPAGGDDGAARRLPDAGNRP